MYHGTPSNPKWRVIAQRCNKGATPGTNLKLLISPAKVIGVWGYLLDVASQSTPRGSIHNFNVEFCSVTLGLAEQDVEAVVNQMRRMELIVDNQLKNWKKRQPVREDSSAERTRRWRARKMAGENGAYPPEAR